MCRLQEKERKNVAEVLRKLNAGNFVNLDIKRLKGRKDIFRVRRRDVRIIYRIDENRKLFILKIERRSEKTYKNLN